MKNSISREFVKVQKRIRKNSVQLDFGTANLFYGELSMGRNIRTAKFPTAKFPNGKNCLRRYFLTVKFPYGEISYGEISLDEIYYGEICCHELSVFWIVSTLLSLRKTQKVQSWDGI